jgi:hypothetical protein
MDFRVMKSGSMSGGPRGGPAQRGVVLRDEDVAVECVYSGIGRQWRQSVWVDEMGGGMEE